MRTRLLIIVVLGVAWYLLPGQAPEPTPEPTPGELNLSGVFIGETAATDAAIVAALAGELADCFEQDKKQTTPVLTTGLKLDELRRRSRSFRCGGRCLSDQHPQLGQRVGDYLEKKLGNSGGPVTAEQLDRWVEAYREIETAAARVIH